MWCRYLNIAPELSITRLYEVQQKDKLKYGSYMNTYWIRITNIDIYNDILGIEGNCDANCQSISLQYIIIYNAINVLIIVIKCKLWISNYVYTFR